MTSEVIRDLHLVDAAHGQALRAQVHDTLVDWARDWWPEADAWAPHCTVHEAGEAEWAPSASIWTAHHGLKTPGWHGHGERTLALLAQRLVARESTTPLPQADWALQAAQSALDDLHQRLLGPVQPEVPAGPDLQPLSGVVCVHEASLALSWCFMPKAMPTPTASLPMTALSTGLASQPVRLHAGLGEVEILVADLLALQAGDVIRFPARLRGGVSLSTERTPGAEPVFFAELGQRDAHVAVRLSAKAAAGR